MNRKPPARNARLLTFLATTAVYATVSGPVQANHEVTVKIPVAATDLDLNRPAGARILYRRLSNAARYACGSSVRVGLEAPTDFQACYQKALSDAVRSVNRPQLTLVYLARHTLQDASAQGVDVPAQVAAK